MDTIAVSITKNKLRFYYFVWDIWLAGFENVGIFRFSSAIWLVFIVWVALVSLHALLMQFHRVYNKDHKSCCCGQRCLDLCTVCQDSTCSLATRLSRLVVLCWDSIFCESQSLKSGDSSQRLFPLPCFTLWSPSRSWLSIVTDASGTQPSLCKEIV